MHFRTMNNFVQCLKSWPVRHCTYSRLLVFINLFSSGACGLFLYATKHAVSYPFLSLEDSKPTARKHHVRVLHWTSLTILRRPVGSNVNWNSCYCFLFCFEVTLFLRAIIFMGFSLLLMSEYAPRYFLLKPTPRPQFPTCPRKISASQKPYAL